ncbi:MAG: YSC84-related protein [Kiritimatiellia bacterium]
MKYAALFIMTICLFATTVRAEDKFEETIELFRNAGQSGNFFDKAVGYAVFPTIGKGGIGVGAAYGSGRVFKDGTYVGDSKMTQVSFGLQLGGQAYSQIVFFMDQSSFDEFTSGSFEFGAQASAVAITAGAQASASTSGASAGANVGKEESTNAGNVYKGMAIFTMAKGGLMYEATISGQKFSYKPVATP